MEKIHTNTMPSFEQLNNTFKLSITSPSGLVWKAKVSTKVVIGKNAGSRRADGYMLTSYYGQRLLCHRIVYILHNQKMIPKGFIVHHIDGNCRNNNPSNLQAVSQRINMQNRKLNNNNTTGHQGVTLYKPTNRYCASITFKYKGKATKLTIGYHRRKSVCDQWIAVVRTYLYQDSITTRQHARFTKLKALSKSASRRVFLGIE